MYRITVAQTGNKMTSLKSLTSHRAHLRSAWRPSWRCTNHSACIARTHSHTARIAADAGSGPRVPGVLAGAPVVDTHTRANTGATPAHAWRYLAHCATWTVTHVRHLALSSGIWIPTSHARAATISARSSSNGVLHTCACARGCAARRGGVRRAAWAERRCARRDTPETW